MNVMGLSANLIKPSTEEILQLIPQAFLYLEQAQCQGKRCDPCYWALFQPAPLVADTEVLGHKSFSHQTFMNLGSIQVLWFSSCALRA